MISSLSLHHMYIKKKIIISIVYFIYELCLSHASLVIDVSPKFWFSISMPQIHKKTKKSSINASIHMNKSAHIHYCYRDMDLHSECFDNLPIRHRLRHLKSPAEHQTKCIIRAPRIR